MRRGRAHGWHPRDHGAPSHQFACEAQPSRAQWVVDAAMSKVALRSTSKHRCPEGGRAVTSHHTDELLDAFFAAIERGDIDAVADFYDDDVAVWHNVTGNALDKADSLALLRYWSRSVEAMHYEILERRTFEGGAVQRHIVHGEADGETIAAQVAILFHVANARITAIYEYLDPAHVAAVFGRTSPSAGEG